MIDTTFMLFGAAILGSAVVLSVLVERLTHRLGATPADPDDKSRGFGDVLSKLGQWARNRSKSDHSNRS